MAISILGPWKVLSNMNDTAYLVQLPANLDIFDVNPL